jgi:hypothetical protein
MFGMNNIERLEQDNDAAVQAREAALNARLRATVRGATAEEKAALQTEVDRCVVDAARAAQALEEALLLEAAPRSGPRGR